MRWTILLLLLPLSLSAVAGNRALVKYRQHVMEASHDHMKAIGSLVLDGVPLRGQLPGHIHAIETFAKELPALFPRGSEGGDAERMIWWRWPDFKARAHKTAQAAAALDTAAVAGDEGRMHKAYYALLDSCKSCHHDYRQEP